MMPAKPPIQCPEPVLAAGMQGIAHVAVNDATARLTVTFLRPIALPQQNYLLDARSYTLTGGVRLFPRVVSVALLPASPPANNSVLLTLDGLGDFSTYTLTVTGPDMDPFFGSRKLRFRLGCDEPFDCRPPYPATPPPPEIPVAIDYLAKDYAGFRQALIDFIPTRLPEWTERNEADIGMMILELFAWTADQLSYMQDRVANEAFLETATQRRSVAEHLALIGYRMDEGNAAETWLSFQVTGDRSISAGFRVSNKPAASSPDEPLTVFETRAGATLRLAHNTMRLADFGNAECCLTRCAVSAVLEGEFGNLNAGDALLFEDGQDRRDIVVLSAAPEILAGPRTLVRWSAQTPLRYDYCVDTAVVHGNLVPATHGETIVNETPRLVNAVAKRPRYRLEMAPLAYFGGKPELTVEVDGEAWEWKATLLDSSPDDKVFRVEVDDFGEATVVFGDGRFGAAPPPTAVVTATYRVGGGQAGNVGADTLILEQPPGSATWLASVTNPVAATGGRDLESRDHARRVAPPGFHTPLVAVTAPDYQTAALSVSGIQRANASFVWTGSWLTVTLAVDPQGSSKMTPELRTALLDVLESRRLTGYDLEVIPAAYLPLDIIVEFCTASAFRPADVQQALEQAIGKQFFSPDQFTFGDDLFVSRLYAAVMAVAGVESAEITRMARLRAARPEIETAANMAQGYLTIGADQILRLDNDRNFPENGVLTIRPKGAAA